MSASTEKEPTKAKWGDEDDEQDDVVPNLTLPEPYETEVDENGFKTKVEFKLVDNQRIKVTKKIKVSTQKRKVNKLVAERKLWPKFGECAGLPDGPEEGVTSLGDEVRIERTKDEQRRKKEESQQTKKGGGLGIVCRLCKMVGDHFTLKCPYRDQLGGMPASDGPDFDDNDDSPSLGGGGPRKFVVPAKRAGGSMAGDSMRSRDDTATIRVTNLSEEITEQDLGDMFGRFGHIQRIYLAKDKNTGIPKGFAFINFVSRANAERAMEELQGFGFDHVILHLEWARPSTRD
eukprot:TRINITY_DN309_c0_g1_i1.p2 TRINITY_DN309_c0_g1~~TRINITY_DN309_c0_g1_i1.p2  ORF type:complete len:289 (+),score=123.07 TRINITY_DN309_c0_g1_i1:88-954(+)